MCGMPGDKMPMLCAEADLIQSHNARAQRPNNWQLYDNYDVMFLMAGLLTAMLMIAGCGPSPDIVLARGRILQISATPLQTVLDIGYSEQQKSYAIRPRAVGKALFLTRVSILNRTAGLASILVDDQAVFVEDSQGNRYRPVNPFEPRDPVTSPLAMDGAFTPFLWGNSEVRENFEVSGWLVFELPQNSHVRVLLWDQVENLRLFFPEPNGQAPQS